MELKAKVVKTLPMEQGVSKSSGNDWKKATIIVETLGQYPKKVALTNLKKAEEFSTLTIGKEYKFKIDVESREFNGKWYTNVNCYAWDSEGQEQEPPQDDFMQLTNEDELAF